MNNLRIAIFDHVGQKAGMDYYDGALMNALSKKINKTYIFSNFIGINSEKIKYFRYYDSFSNHNKLILSFRFIISTFKSSLKAKRMSIDLVIAHIFSAQLITLLLVLIPRLFNLKIAIILHDISSFRNTDKQIFQNIIYNKLVKFIVVHNQYSYNELLKLSIVNNQHKINIIKHGGFIDFTDRCNRTITEIKESLGFDITKKHILFFGQIKKVKGLDLLLNALRSIENNIQLIIAGNSNSENFSNYDNKIKKYHLQDKVVKISRYLNHNEVIELFKASDIIILPYKNIYQSGVLLMAMSYKLPVLASNLTPITEIIKHKENGLLFKINDINDLSDKINKYINNIKLLEEIAINAYQTIEEYYSWDNIANKYIQVIDKSNFK